METQMLGVELPPVKDSTSNLHGTKSYEDSILKQIRAIKTELGRTDMRMETNNPLIPEVLDAARTNRYSVLGFDIEFKGDLGRRISHVYEEVHVKGNRNPNLLAKFNELIYTMRNQVMADNIARSFQKHQCERAIVVSGSGHLETEVDGKKYSPLHEILALKKGLNSVAYLALTCESKSHDSQLDPGCNWVAGQPTPNVYGASFRPGEMPPFSGFFLTP